MSWVDSGGDCSCYAGGRTVSTKVAQLLSANIV